MSDEKQGISNRETGREEHEERQEFGRPDNVTRDAAGHVHRDSPADEEPPRDDQDAP